MHYKGIYLYPKQQFFISADFHTSIPEPCKGIILWETNLSGQNKAYITIDFLETFKSVNIPNDIYVFNNGIYVSEFFFSFED